MMWMSAWLSEGLSAANCTTNNGGGDTYVAKLAPDGSSLVWGTYLGGASGDGVLGKHGIAVDTQGMVYVGSDTESNDFPTTPGAFQTTYGGGGHVFV